MTSLDVPYRKQINESSCGVAALEMVFRYFRPSKLSKFNQEKIFKRLQENEPLGSGNLRVSSDAIVELAKERNLFSGWGRVSTDPQTALTQIRSFTETMELPLIACQQWHKDRKLGHFKVITGVENGEVIFHDPEDKVGGQFLRSTIEAFHKDWEYTGLNVTGGVAIWVSDEQTVIDSLDPGAPNKWVA